MLNGESDAVELYRKYRPNGLKKIVGQDEVVATLQKWLNENKVPHALLFAGPSGVGKTTLARVLARKLGCDEYGYEELNCADLRGIDNAREIRSRMYLAPVGGKARVFCLDEVHKTTNDFQNAILKVLEDTPKHVYFVLCTTEPSKLIPTIRTRCTILSLTGLSPQGITDIVGSVVEAEGLPPLSDAVVSAIVESADGSARKALVLLQTVLALNTDEERIAAVSGGDDKSDGITLARALFKPKPDYKEVRGIIRSLSQEPEAVRKVVMSYAGAIALGGGKMYDKAIAVMKAFRFNTFDNGKWDILMCCHELFHPEG